MLAQATVYASWKGLAPADSEMGEVLMGKEQPRQLDAFQRQGQLDPAG